MITKKCNKCQVEKSINEFYLKNCNYTCKSCEKKRRKEYYLLNKHYIDAHNKKWYQKNKKKKLQYELEYKNQRRKTDLLFKLKCDMRNTFLQAVNRNSKKTSVINLIGCTIQELKLHLESKFQNGMTWENRGLYGWHIDHIKPIDSFDLTNIEEQKKCFHYTNLQPLWAKDNLSKGNKLV